MVHVFFEMNHFDELRTVDIVNVYDHHCRRNNYCEFRRRIMKTL